MMVSITPKPMNVLIGIIERRTKMKVLVLEPNKKPYVKEIDGYADMREIVGGWIETVEPDHRDDDNVVIVCNEEGKIMGLPWNRPLLYKGRMFDMLCGTGFVTDCGDEDFIGLTDEQIEYYSKQYEHYVVDLTDEEENLADAYFEIRAVR